MSIKDNPGLWCDDITFCPYECMDTDCPRNKKNIRDKFRPISFCCGLPKDCPRLDEPPKEG
jgi:hypothetical protein